MISGDYQHEERAPGPAPRRRLAAILRADIAGYSTLMADAEEETHQRVGAAIDRVNREISRSGGRIFTFAGDGLMAEFPSAVSALRCALRLQADAARAAAAEPQAEPIAFRIGLHAGELITQRGRTGGHAVNIAARLEAMAQPGGICLSGAVHEQVRRAVIAPYRAGGEQTLKNIREAVAIFRIEPADCASWGRAPVQLRVPPPAAAPATSAPDFGEYRASLAVLPFRTLQPDQSDAYFAEGMVDDIIRALGGLKDLLVISRSSAHVFANAPLDLRRIADDLDVRYVVHGSVRRAGEALRISVELVEAPGGAVIWGDRFDGSLADLFEFQDRIAIRVATAISPNLRERELSRALRKRPEHMTAYDLTLQALDHINLFRRDSFAQGRALLQEAIALDPNHGAAHSQLAAMLMHTNAQGWSDDSDGDNAAAVEAARAAIRCDPNDAVGLSIFGHMQSYLLRDYQTADSYLERATAVGPSSAWAWGYSAVTRGYMGDVEGAVARAERAVRLSPVGADAYWFEAMLAQSYYLAERFEDAASWFRMSASRVEQNSATLRGLIAALVAAGETLEATRVAERVMQVSPGYTVRMFRDRTPFTGDAREVFATRLREAGIPEE